MGLLVRDTKDELSTGTLSGKKGRFGNREYRKNYYIIFIMIELGEIITLPLYQEMYMI